MRTLLALWVVLLWGAPALASAHAFGQQYSLPLPLSYYITGGVCAFLISCVLLLFIKKPYVWRGKEILLPESSWKAVRFSLQTVFMALFAIALGAGILGHPAAYDNVLVVLFWIGMVLVLPYSAVLLAGVWETGNPFAMLAGRLAPKGTAVEPWEKTYEPALAGYIGLIALELFLSPYAATPLVLVACITLYTAVVLYSVRRWGAEWLQYGEFFSVFIGLFGKLSPVRLEDGKLILSSPASRLTVGAPQLSLLLFILFGLAATAFDGVRETGPWAQVLNSIPFGAYADKSMLGFAVLVTLFIGLYSAAMYGIRTLVHGRRSLHYYLLRFAFSLVPIMAAYHFAHYFQLVFTTGTYLVPLMSDPFGMGWNLFGTADSTFSVLLGAQTIWYVQFSVIVSGHMFAAYVAHKIALEEFGSGHRALVSQLPLIVLMVFYTAFGLWILGQPFAANAL